MSAQERADRQKMSAFQNPRPQNQHQDQTKADKATYLRAVAVASAKKRFLPVDAVPLPKRGSSQQHGHCPEAAQAGWIAPDGTFSKTNKGGKLQPAWRSPDGTLHMTGAGRSNMEIKQEQAEAASSSSDGRGGGSNNTVFRSL